MKRIPIIEDDKILRARVNTQLRRGEENRDKYSSRCFVFDFERMEFYANGTFFI